MDNGWYCPGEDPHPGGVYVWLDGRVKRADGVPV